MILSRLLLVMDDDISATISVLADICSFFMLSLSFIEHLVDILKLVNNVLFPTAETLQMHRCTVRHDGFKLHEI